MDRCDHCNTLADLFHNDNVGLALCETCDQQADRVEEIAGAVATLLISTVADGPTRRAAVKRAAERFGFTVTDTHDLDALARELGIEV